MTRPYGKAGDRVVVGDVGMFKKSLSVLFVISIVVFSNITVSFAETKDVFEQINNYLMLGHAHRKTLDGATAVIVKRKVCRAGVEWNDGDYMLINWNNVIVDDVKIQEKWINRKKIPFLILEGNKSVIDINFHNQLRAYSFAQAGIVSGSHNKITIPMPDLDSDRMVNAIKLLFKKYCKGKRRKSAF